MNNKIPIYRLFGQSPFEPLQQHMSKVQKAALLLIDFFKYIIDEKWEKAKNTQEEIAKLEGEADVLKKEMRLHLPKSLFLPVSRTDLLEMLTKQDKIANRAKDIAGLVLGRNMKLPKQVQKSFLSLLTRSIDATNQAASAISELEELLEAGFKGHEVKIVSEMIKKLDKIERDTDTIQVKVRKQLYTLEKNMPAVDVMFLYKIIEWTGDLADRAQHVGAQLELLLAK